jgi:translation initiation factor IF-3
VSLTRHWTMARAARLDLVLISPEADAGRLQGHGLWQARIRTEEAACGQSQEAESCPDQGNEVSSRDGGRGLSGKTTQPDTFPHRWGQGQGNPRFRGREMAHQEIGAELMQRLKEDLAEHGISGAGSKNGRQTADHGARPRQKEKVVPPAESRSFLQADLLCDLRCKESTHGKVGGSCFTLISGRLT